MAYYNDNDEIQCPYCEYVFYKSDFYPGQDEITEVICEGCGKTYTISTSYSRSFTTHCGDEKTLDCAFVPALIYGKVKKSEIGGKTMIYAECTRCAETQYADEEKVDMKGISE